GSPPRDPSRPARCSGVADPFAVTVTARCGWGSCGSFGNGRRNAQNLLPVALQVKFASSNGHTVEEKRLEQGEMVCISALPYDGKLVAVRILMVRHVSRLRVA